MAFPLGSRHRVPPILSRRRLMPEANRTLRHKAPGGVPPLVRHELESCAPRLVAANTAIGGPSLAIQRWGRSSDGGGGLTAEVARAACLPRGSSRHEVPVPGTLISCRSSLTTSISLLPPARSASRRANRMGRCTRPSSGSSWTARTCSSGHGSAHAPAGTARSSPIRPSPSSPGIAAFPHVAAHATDPDSIRRCSDGFLTKYRKSKSAQSMVAEDILDTTLRLEPS